MECIAGEQREYRLSGIWQNSLSWTQEHHRVCTVGADILEANDIKEEKQVAVLLSVIGSKTFVLLQSLEPSKSPTDKTFVQLVAVLTQHFEPQPVIIIQQFHFHRQNQEPGESTADNNPELC